MNHSLLLKFSYNDLAQGYELIYQSLPFWLPFSCKPCCFVDGLIININYNTIHDVPQIGMCLIQRTFLLANYIRPWFFNILSKVPATWRRFFAMTLIIVLFVIFHLIFELTIWFKLIKALRGFGVLGFWGFGTSAHCTRLPFGDDLHRSAPAHPSKGFPTPGFTWWGALGTGPRGLGSSLFRQAGQIA